MTYSPVPFLGGEVPTPVYWVLLALLIVPLVVGVFAFRERLRRTTCLKLLARSESEMSLGNRDSAIAFLLKSERLWSLSAFRGGRENALRDFSIFADIVARLDVQLSMTEHEDTATSVRRLCEIVNELIRMHSDKDNFACDGYRPKNWSIAKTFSELIRELERVRGALHRRTINDAGEI
jgi:hypothetical protein